MIVSHQHRFIFFAVPRTGTHSVRAALKAMLGPDDWQQETLRERVRMPVPALARIGHGHVTFAQARAALPETTWRGYFKFACVRNPYDRFVSACAMLNGRNPDYRGRENAFMKRALTFPRFRQRVLVRPQWDMLVDAQGALAMDFVGRYECLDQSMRDVCRHLGIPATTLPRRNASEHGDYRQYYDDELLRIVTDFYRRDFDGLDYRVAASPKELPCA